MLTKVTIKKNYLKNGTISLHLAYYPPFYDAREHKIIRTENLQLSLIAKPKTAIEKKHNADMEDLALAIQSKRLIQIRNEEFDFLDKTKGSEDFLAYFEKDNDASSGTKGDFIFRDFADGKEYVSIMFEMKNEMDTTATKHKNDDFLKKLDEDRRKKNCEFAVLVSLLESDNDLYNTGIVNKSHVYPKMYVIRPQFFIPFINLLVQTSKKSLEYRKQLILAQNKEADVTNFENKLNDFRAKFGRHYEMASKKFDDAIKDIDATIAKLQKVREELVGSENSLRLANQDTEDLTIRKLTYRNPTMKAKFEEARKADGIPTDDL